MQVLRLLPALTAVLFLSLLLSSGAQENLIKPQVWVHPPNPVILSGSSIVMNCSTDCVNPTKIGLETRLMKILEGDGPNWKAWRLRNVTWDNSPLCYVNCPGQNQGSTRANIEVYEPPKNLELNLEPSQEQSSLPWIFVGQNITLSCHVAGGRPRENLMVVLLRGTQEISRQPVPDNTFDTVIVKFWVIASRKDDEANFSCHAELNLQSRGLQLYQNSSAPLRFYTFALAQEPPVLVTPKLLEAGTKKQVSCEMDKLFPVEKAHIQLSWGGQRLIQDITRHGDMLRATATIMAAKEEKGDRELTCNVRLGNETRNISEDLTIYTFPQPRLVVSEPIQEGYRVNLTCAADPPATVMIEGAPRDEPDRISLIVQEKDNGRLFTCQATLKLQKETLHKNSSLNLNVLFPPKLDEKCPGNWTWNEGTEQTLQCIARGNPDPTMKCVPENQQTGMPFGIPTTVIRAYSGTYRCTANNSLGVANKVVSVVVKFQDVNLRPILIGTLVSMVAVGIVISVGYVYYRQQRIRSYELKKAQEARALQPIKTEDKLCP
ncbi:intercellular adhesion molecule 1-like isoform X1 [Vombatus ursinus]|uniref:Ig-like domain-containing protein n=1 Tax=Vombatus ursinus TaxID=29139 RepID=A0A4X2M4K8_VOMUR|nr:intercellular adhesion molecule 1-like isoform X1 [Vombatus ursinus]